MPLRTSISDGIDVAIRSGNGDWPDLECHRLIDIDFTPMLSPELAASIGGVTKPEDLLQLPILAGADPWWIRWFAEAGIDATDFGGQAKQSFGPQVLEATAAIAGQGVAMLTPAFFRTALRSGQLIRPFDLCCSDGTAYWLTHAEVFRNTPKIRAFRDWLTGEVDRFPGDRGIKWPYVDCRPFDWWCRKAERYRPRRFSRLDDER